MTCSICYANFHIPCQANCSHWLCEYLYITTLGSRSCSSPM
ncbi:hypothetical protein OROGR_032548 [Orobanche gracilis]